MSFIDCLQKTNKLTPAQMKRLRDMYDTQVKVRDSRGQPAVSSAIAARNIVTAEAERIATKKINLQRDAVVINDFWEKANANFEKRKAAWEKAKKDSAAKKLLMEAPGISWLLQPPSINQELERLLNSMDYRSAAIKDMYMRQMRGAYEAMMPDVLAGTMTSAERKEYIKLVWMEAGGQSTGNPQAASHGKMVRKTFDDMHSAYKSKGGILGKLENWMPQIHNSKAIKLATKDVWKNYIRNKLDWERITDDYGTQIPEEFREEFLDDVYETLSTDGAAEKVRLGEQGRSKVGGKSFASRRDHSRVLHFKSPKLQFEYNQEFGTEDLFVTLINHVDKMSRDMAILDNMGNPETFINNAELRMGGELDPFIKKMYQVSMGRTAMTGAEGELYKFSVGVGAWLRGIQLGGAPIAALGDQVFVQYRSFLAGNNGFEATSEYYKALTKKVLAGDMDARLEAELNVYNMEAAMGNLTRKFFEGDSFSTQGQTISDKVMSSGQNFSSAIMRGSLLTHMTQSAKDAVTIPTFGKFARESKKSWAELDNDFKESLYDIAGIEERDWDFIRSVEPITMRGEVKILLPSDVISKNQDIGLKYSAYIEGLRRLAVNEPTTKTRAVTTGGLEAGGVDRFFRNSAFMYKSFPITMLNHYMRPALHRAMVQGKGGELAVFSATLIAMGYLTLMAKDALRNKTPRDILDPDSPIGLDVDTLRQAALQSGALSVFDFAIKDGQNRFGQDLQKALLGPLINAGIDTYSLGDSALSVYANHDHYWETLKKKGVDFARRYQPGATLWWTKLGWNLTIGDSLNEAIEGDAYYRRKRRDEQVMDENGQEYLDEWFKREVLR